MINLNVIQTVRFSREVFLYKNEHSVIYTLGSYLLMAFNRVTEKDL